MSLGYKCNTLCFMLMRLVVFVLFPRKRKIDEVDGAVSKKQKKEDEKLELKLKVWVVSDIKWLGLLWMIFT